MKEYVVEGNCRYIGRGADGNQVTGTAAGQATFFAMSHDENIVRDTAVLAMSDSPKLAGVDDLTYIRIVGFVIWRITLVS